MRSIYSVSFFLTSLIVLSACDVSRQLTKDDMTKGRDIQFLSVERNDKTVVDFSPNELGHPILRDSIIYRQKRREGMEIIPIDQVNLSKAVRRSTATEDSGNVTALVFAGVAAALLALRFIPFH